MTMSLEVDDLDGLSRFTCVPIFCRSVLVSDLEQVLTLDCVIQL
jgi:hypothetical protein